MAGYGTALDADFFAGSVSFFHDLVGRLCADATAAMTHDQLEELIEVRGRELLRLLLQDHLDLRAVREEQSLAAAKRADRRADRSAARVMVDAGGVAHRVIETGHERCLASVVGPVTVRRAAFRAGGTANLYPADARLNLSTGRHSHGLRKRAVVEAVRGSFDDAVAAIRRCCGNVVAKRQVERLVIAAARDVEAFYEARVPLPCTAATLLVISCDGKGVPMRPEALRPATARAAAVKGGNTYRTRLAGGEKSGRKRMATVAAVYDAEPAVRRPHDVITLSGSGTAMKNGPGPNWRTAWSLHTPGDPAAERWVAIQLLAILFGRLEETLTELRRQARAAELTAEQRKGIETCTKYLMAKRGYLGYAEALAAGWPIATGVVEGACRHLVADRLNITGARWGLDGAEAVLKLRAVISNGHLEPYWTFHLQQEHHRVHQARYQDGYQLTA